MRKGLTYVLQQTPDPCQYTLEFKIFFIMTCGLGVFLEKKKLVWCWTKVSFRNFRLDILIPVNQWFNWVNKIGLKGFILFSYLWICFFWLLVTETFYWLLVTETQALFVLIFIPFLHYQNCICLAEQKFLICVSDVCTFQNIRLNKLSF